MENSRAITPEILRSGASITDSSGNDHPGSFAGSPTWIAGVSNGALSFPTATDGVTTPGSAFLDAPQELTISAWIKHASASNFKAIVDKRDAGSDGYDLFLDTSGKLMMRVNDKTLVGTTDLDDGDWHHVVGVYDGSSIKLYVDGDLEKQSSIGSQSIRTSADFRVGRHWQNTQFSFDGSIDEVLVYNRGISAQEIQDLYENIDPNTGGGDGDGDDDPGNTGFHPTDLSHLAFFIDGADSDGFEIIDCNTQDCYDQNGTDGVGVYCDTDTFTRWMYTKVGRSIPCFSRFWTR